MPQNKTVKAIRESPLKSSRRHESSHQAYDKGIFSWSALEYIQHEKSKKWYMIEAFVVIALLLYTVISANYTMSLALITFVIVYHYLHLKHPPKNIKIIVSKMGIKIGNTTLPYSHIESFWIMYNPPFLKTLNLRVKKHFFVDITVQLADMDPALIRHFLIEQIPELKGKTEQLSDALLRFLKL